jgi:hypothetical protein
MAKWKITTPKEALKDMLPMTAEFDYGRAVFVGFKIKPNKIYGFIFSIDDSEQTRQVLRRKIATSIVDKKKPLIVISAKANAFHEYLKRNPIE